MRAIRVVVADDDPVFTDALVDVLAADPRFDVVGAAGTGAQLLALVAETAPDLALVDVRMPGGGPAAVRALTTGDGHRPLVVAVSAQHGTTAILAMLRAGAVGFLAKGSLGDRLPDLVARAAAGEVVLAAPDATEALRRLVALSPLAPAPVVL